MSDLIDRQAMLKHIEKIRQDALKMDDLHEKSTIMNGMLLLEEAVRNQPSVQPEIIECGYCEWWKLSLYNTVGLHICNKFTGVRGEHDFCSRGERRTDG